jgi:crotonobetainyl-CoA:carnitine CoA-transferase CaiB-like acyl-CoA transferase
MLAALGADVIKVEAPGGDDMRAIQPPGRNGEAASFLALNRGKRSVVLDLGKPAARDIVRRLVPLVDAVVENFRPGTMQEWQLDEASLRPLNDGLVYCSISGYGQQGKYSRLGGYDPIAQAEAGLMYLTGDPAQPPVRAGGSVTDVLTGLHAGMGLLAALCGRARGGAGDQVDVSLFGSTLSSIGYILQGALLTGTDPERTGNASTFTCPNGVFRCADGDIMLTVGNDRLFARFCARALDQPSLADDPRFLSNPDRLANADALNAILNARFAGDTRAAWVGRLRAAGIPVGSVRTPVEAVNSDEASECGMVQDMVHPRAGALRVIGAPIRLSSQPGATAVPSPVLGQHTDTVLGELLGMTAPELADLHEAGVIF